MQSTLSALVIISMLGQTLLGILPPAISFAPDPTPGASQLTTPTLQEEEDPCMLIAIATYLPIVMRGDGGGNVTVAQEPIISKANTAALKGRVLDANDAANGIETPLVDVTVCSLETGQAVKTNDNGEFLLPNLPDGESHVQYIGDTALPVDSYASYRSKITLAADSTTEIERPIYLMKKDPGGEVQIDPNQTTTLVNSTLGIEMEIPPHTVKGDDGQDFDGMISVSEVPVGFTPGSLPNTLEPDFVVTIQPMGLTFAQPVPITFPNTDNLPAGSEVDFWSMDHETGTFFVAGTGKVSNDGTIIETISGGVREASWHFPMSPAPPQTPSTDTDSDNQLPENGGQCFSSLLTTHNGSLQTNISLPDYFSLGQSRSLDLVYNSNRAYPFQLIPAEPTILKRAAVPSKVSVNYNINSAAISQTGYINTAGLNESVNEPLRAVLPLDTSNFNTGVYNASLRVTSHYNQSAVSSANNDQLVIVNEQGSSFGAGWGLAGLSRLIKNADNTILVVDGNGSATLFDAAALDLSTWTQEGDLNNGTWNVSQDGTSVLQIKDAPHTFFVSPDDHINTTIRGKFKVETSQDDDFIGFVFGYQSPIALNGDSVENSDFILFDWKQSYQVNAGGYVGEEGFRLSRVNGTVTHYNYFWGHAGPEFDTIATSYGSDKGWLDNTEYDFELLYESGRIKISINNETIFDVLGSFPEGRFGFYGLSQAQVRYSDFTASKVTTVFQGPPGDYSTLTKNNDGTYTRRLKDGTEIQFNSTGLQTSVIDRNGNTTSYTYDGQGRLTSITDPAGLVTTLTYSGGLLSSVTLPDGRVTTFTHNGSDLTGVTLPDGSSQSFGYDSRHLMTAETDRRGQTRTRQFDQYGRVTQATMPDGSSRTTSAAQTVGLIDPASGVGTEANPAPVERPSNVWSELTDGEGRLRTFTTGPVNSFAGVTDPAGLTTDYERDQDGNATQISQPSGAIYDQSYDSRGNLTGFTDRTLNGTTNFSYDSTFNQVTSITDPFNETTSFSYDSAGNLTQLTTPLNRTATFEYDGRGLVTRAVDPLGTEATFSYNGDGNVTQITQGSGPAQRTASLSYTPEGYVDSLTDPLGRVFDTNYDSLGRPVSESLPGGRTISYGYDNAGNLTSLTPPGQPAHTFSYDAMGLVSAYTPSGVPGDGSNQTLYSYNNAQELTQITRPDGQTLAIAYDSAGRRDTLTIPRGQLDTTYSASTGQITSLAAPDGVNLGYSYDDDILTRVTWSGPINGSVSYLYDKKGRTTRLTLHNNQWFGYSYDADDRVTQAGQLSLTYDAQNGLLNGTTLANVSDGWSFNQFAELSSYNATANSSPLFATAYGRDALGRIITKTETISGVATNYGYSYDAAGRLAEVQTNGVATEQYTYDLNGNRLTALGGVSATYDDQDRLLTYGTNSYTYTANGELLSKTTISGATSYNYDVLGNLMGVTLPNSDQIDYLIDGENRRIGKKVNGTLERGWLYQDGLNPVVELDGAGNVVTLFIYASRGHVPDYMVKGGVLYRLISDHLGSVRLVVNSSSGAVAQRLDYDAFGRVLLDTNPGFQPFGFAGGLYDPDTGLVRFGARDYDAEVGRWTVKDPIGFTGGDSNLYGYVGGDPVNYIDPTGYWINFVVNAVVWGVRATGAVGTRTAATAGVRGGIGRLAGSLPRSASLIPRGFPPYPRYCIENPHDCKGDDGKDNESDAPSQTECESQPTTPPKFDKPWHHPEYWNGDSYDPFERNNKTTPLPQQPIPILYDSITGFA